MDAFIDKTIAGRYRCVKKIGAGGMGVVYLAEDTVLQREVVLKTILLTAREEKAASRFLREAKIMSKLNHPHIVTIHDFGTWEGNMFIIMEYLQGKTLDQIILEKAPLPTLWISNALSQIMDALEAAHDAGIIHRDLKPANIFCLPQPGQPDTIKILDFGTAISLNQEDYQKITTVGEVIGTPHYMSPEQIMGKEDISRSSDIYSLGVILYEMIKGTPPFPGENTMSILLAHLYRTPEPLDEKMAGDDPQRRRLLEIVDTCLNKNAGDRYDSIPELRKALVAEPGKATAVRFAENLADDRGVRYKHFYQGPIEGADNENKSLSTTLLSRMRLLVVEAEDSPVEQSIMPLLKIANYSVESPSFPDGDMEALKTMKPPAAIILNKGKEDTLRLMEEIQKIEDWKTVPCLVCGPEEDLDYISRAIEVGASDYLSYPFDPREILKRIDRLSPS